MTEKNLNFVYVIPARSGSKGVRDKNIRQLGHRSLIEISVDCIREHNPNALIILNSDSENYLTQTRREIIKYKRPFNLGGDNVLMCDVLNEMDLNCREYSKFQYVSIVQPTCPFRLPLHHKIAENKYQTGDHQSLTSVTRVDDMHPARMYRVFNERLISLDEHFESSNRQQLPEVYHRNGLIYLTTKEILKTGKILDSEPGYIEIPRRYCLNIDDEFDWHLANALFNY